MVKIIEVSSKIEKLHDDMIFLMKQYGDFKLIDTLKHTRPLWADEDDYYYDRYTYTYEWHIKDGMETIAEHLLNVAYDGDFLN